jgi:5-(carboxyamino)imidazole ribonucleotide mutase
MWMPTVPHVTRRAQRRWPPWLLLAAIGPMGLVPDREGSPVSCGCRDAGWTFRIGLRRFRLMLLRGETVRRVLIVMGSDSDLRVMKGAADALTELGVPCEVRIASAHRTPEKTAGLVTQAEAEGYGAIIAGAGGAAHLPGVVAAATILPVIGVPIATGALNGVDALYAIVQMPKGIPVATVATDGAYNAGLLAAQILATGDPELAARLRAHRQQLARQVEDKDRRLQELGVDGYLAQR